MRPTERLLAGPRIPRSTGERWARCAFGHGVERCDALITHQHRGTERCETFPYVRGGADHGRNKFYAPAYRISVVGKIWWLTMNMMKTEHAGPSPVNMRLLFFRRDGMTDVDSPDATGWTDSSQRDITFTDGAATTRGIVR